MIASKRVHRRWVFGATGVVLCLLAGCASPPSGLTTPEEPVLFPLPPDPPRVQFLTSITRSDAIVEPESAFQRFVVGAEGAAAAIQGPVHPIAHRNTVAWIGFTRAHPDDIRAGLEHSHRTDRSHGLIVKYRLPGEAAVHGFPHPPGGCTRIDDIGIRCHRIDGQVCHH